MQSQARNEKQRIGVHPAHEFGKVAEHGNEAENGRVRKDCAPLVRVETKSGVPKAQPVRAIRTLKVCAFPPSVHVELLASYQESLSIQAGYTTRAPFSNSEITIVSTVVSDRFLEAPCLRVKERFTRSP